MAQSTNKASGSGKGKAASAKGKSASSGSGGKSAAAAKKSPAGQSKAAAGEKNASGGARPARSKAAIAREQEMQREKELEQQRINVISLIMFAFSVVFLVLVVFPKISPNISSMIFGLFGSCSIVWAIAFFIISAITAGSVNDENAGFKCKMTILSAFVVSAFIHCATAADDLKGSQATDMVGLLYSLGESHTGGGAIGGLPGAIMARMFGKVLSMVIIVLIAFVVLMLVTRTTLPQLGTFIANGFSAAKRRTVDFASGLAEDINEAKAERRREEEENERERVRLLDQEFYDEDEYDESLKRQKKTRRLFRLGDKELFGCEGEQDGEYEEDETQDGSDEYYPEEYEDAQPDAQPEPESVPRRSKKGRRNRAADRDADIVQDLIGDDGTLTEVPEFIKDENAAVTDEEFEDLYSRVVNQTKRQREEELLSDTMEFASEVADMESDEPIQYHFPSISLLGAPTETDDENLKEELRHNAERLVKVLAEYGVEASVSDISHGPTVTRYEITPAPGVRISKITNLTKDMALRLAAISVRIEAPIPGKAAVGVEIPNKTPGTVYVRSLINNETFRNSDNPLTLALGQDIDGNNIYCNISKMPHLLIAGSTGTGKSVCINSMLTSLLYKASPSDVRLIMIDPKAVELDVYNGIPHLLVPVVTNPQKAAGALQWAVGEMEKRYSLLGECKVRNIDGYNALTKNNPELRRMPRILIVIDELADLMMTAPKEVETAIARLAAKARAAGIHMILATQRPSVDVITGTIKNNIPSRIAFAVASQVDSRTILDDGGAEQLIGRGDMLFKPIGTKFTRIQGCFVSDDEVTDIVEFIKENSKTDYDEDIKFEIERNAAGISGEALPTADDSDEDELFMQAVEEVVSAGQASTSLLQRRLSIGYARAGRLIDQLCDRGIIGPFCGSKPREVLITSTQLMEMQLSRQQPRQPAEQPAERSSSPSLSHNYTAYRDDQESEEEYGQQRFQEESDEDGEDYGPEELSDDGEYYDGEEDEEYPDDGDDPDDGEDDGYPDDEDGDDEDYPDDDEDEDDGSDDDGIEYYDESDESDEDGYYGRSRYRDEEYEDAPSRRSAAGGGDDDEYIDGDSGEDDIFDDPPF